MNIKEKLEQARVSYLEKYRYSPNIIFVGQDLIEELSIMIGGDDFYQRAHSDLWGCDVIPVLSEDTLKFADHADIRKAVNQYRLDNSLDSYSVPKSRSTLGSRANGIHTESKVIDLEPIEFTKEEIEIYSMQS